MENKFKQFYDYIIEDIGKTVHTKHHNHSNFYNEVNRIREDIKSGDQSWKSNKSFLERLIYNQDNGIVNLPHLHQSFSDVEFQNLIINDRFLSALEEFIVSPTQDTHTKLEKTWVDQQDPITGQHNIAAINRVASACTTEVSTVVPIVIFDNLFDWLIREKMILMYPSNSDQRWFSKNQFLMKEVQQKFNKELASGETDEIYLCDFIWYLHDYTKNLPSRRKIR